MPPKAKSQGFFDTYKDTGPAAGGGTFVKKDEKDWLIQNGITIKILGLAFEPDAEHGPRWVALTEIPNAETGDWEERKMSFPVETNVPTRDAMLTAMHEYFQENATPVEVKLIQPGRAIHIVNANA